jgi:hypothetical protein
MEYWSFGVLENWSNGVMDNIPKLTESEFILVLLACLLLFITFTDELRRET